MVNAPGAKAGPRSPCPSLGSLRGRLFCFAPPFFALLLAAAGLTWTAPPVFADHKVHVTRTAVSPADAALNSYIERVRAASAAEVRSPGSLWSEDGRLTRLSADVKATHPHDLISIVVSESLTASTDGTVKNSRASSASAQISALAGSLSAANALQNLLNQTSTSALNAQGQSVTDSSLSTILGGEVMAVLPNGALVIQADRQVAFNQQTQTIRLRGLVRPADVNSQNQVLSTSITDLELEVVGKGIINDFTYRQNVVVRLLERLLVF